MSNDKKVAISYKFDELLNDDAMSLQSKSFGRVFI